MNKQRIMKHTKWILFLSFIAYFTYAVVVIASGQEIQINQTVVNDIHTDAIR